MEARGADRGGEEEDADESDGANDSLMKAEAARQKASLVFRSARVLLRHRSHPLCVYTCIRGVSDQPYSPPTIDAVRVSDGRKLSWIERESVSVS